MECALESPIVHLQNKLLILDIAPFCEPWAQIVLWVINPLSTQLKGYQPKIKQPGCLSRLITPWVNNPNKQPGLFKIRVNNPKMEKFVNSV
jgi:hypothetical protein